MSDIKSLLKQAKLYISQKQYKQALDTADQILKIDKENYNALVFAALSNFNLDQLQLAITIYTKATQSDPKNPLAYQGLQKLYQATDPNSVDLHPVLHSLVLIYHELTDGNKCFKTINELISLSAKLDDPALHIEALCTLLPESIVYPTIKSQQLPPTHLTLLTVASIQSKYEADTFKKEVEAKRMRLGADSLQNIKFAVEKELVLKSPLETIYDRLLSEFKNELDNVNTIKSDLLNFLTKKLIYSSEKERLCKKIRLLCRDLIREDNPPRLAFEFLIENSDVDSYYYDVTLLDTLMKTNDSEFYLFTLVKKYLDWRNDKLDVNDIAVVLELSEENDSIFGYHTLSMFSLETKEFTDSCLYLEKCRTLLLEHQKTTGLFLNRVSLSIDLLYCENLWNVDSRYYKTNRKNLPEALKIYTEILEKEPQNIRALYGVGRVYQSMIKYEEASSFYSKAITNETDKSCFRYIDCKIELGWCNYLLDSNKEKVLEFLQNIQKILETLTFPYKNELLSKCLFRIGKVYWDMAGNYRTDKRFSFTSLLQSAKHNPKYGATFIYLGSFYMTIENDTKRSIKCFEKAHLLTVLEKSFPLEDDETDPSQCLTNLYIQSNDLPNATHILDQVVIDKPRENWAWKRLGILRLHTGDYPGSITALQTACRCVVDDVITWTCLADAYIHEGKYMASLKAYNRVLSLCDGKERVYTLYQMAGVYSRLGQFQDAVGNYREILKEGIHVPTVGKLGECYLALIRELIGDGNYGNAVELLKTCLGITVEGINSNTTKKHVVGNAALLKIVGDSCSIIRLIPGYISLFSVTIFHEIESISENILATRHIDKHQAVSLDYILITGLSSYKAAVTILQHSSIIKNDEFSQVVAGYWHDIGLMYFWRFTINEDISLLTESIKSLKFALKLSPMNDMFWNTLGYITLMETPLLAQHCFIKAIELDSKSPIAWCNLGFLYISQNEMGLASQAFAAAQFADSDWALSLFGQAWIDLKSKCDLVNVFHLFENSLDIGGGAVPEINFHFAYQYFIWKLENSSSDDDLSDYSNAIVSLTKFVDRVRPDGISFSDSNNRKQLDSVCCALNLMGILYEKQNMFDSALKCFDRCLKIFDYLGEDGKFKVLINKARCLCSLGNFAESVDVYKSLGDKLDQGICQVGFGLALYLNSSYSESLKWFESGLENVDASLHGEVMVMVAQVLFTLGGQEHIQLGKQQLFDCLTKVPNNLEAIFGLAAIGLLQNDLTLAQSASSELIKITPDILASAGLEGDVELILSQLFLGQKNHKTALCFLSRAIHRYPSRAASWSRLSKLILQLHPERSSNSLTVAKSSIILPFASHSKSSVGKIYVNYGISLFSAGGTAGPSKAAFLRAVRANPNDLQSWVGLCISIRSELAHSYNKLGEDDMMKKVSQLENLLFFITNTARTQLQEAQRLMEKSKVFDMEKLLKWVPLMLSDCKYFQSKLTEDKNTKESLLKESYALAEQILVQSNERKLQSSCLLIMARCLLLNSDLAGSVDAFKKVIQLDPNSVVWEELASVYRKHNLFDASDICLRQSIMYSSENCKIRPLVRLTILALMLNNFALASEALGEINKNEDSGIINKFLQCLLQHCSGNNKAVKTLSSIKACSETFPWIYWLSALINKGNNESGQKSDLENLEKSFGKVDI